MKKEIYVQKSTGNAFELESLSMESLNFVKMNDKNIKISVSCFDIHQEFSKYVEEEKPYSYLPLNAAKFLNQLKTYEYTTQPTASFTVNKKDKKNVNQDILKLIEAGYDFSSFWGDTVDGRSINVDLNEEEVK